MNFEGCLPQWKSEAEKYLLACYIDDWSPEALVARDERVSKLNDVTNKRKSNLPTPLKPKKKKKVQTGIHVPIESFLVMRL